MHQPAPLSAPPAATHRRAPRLRPAPGGVLSGLGGAAVIAGALLTPPLRGRRCRWGAGPAVAERRHPGDELIPSPRWGWTHAVTLASPTERVWPWVAQIGADRAGFYSYTWLENLAGCGIRDADRVHPEWQARPGDGLVLHPSAPPLVIREVEEGRHLLAHGAADEGARAAGRPWVEATWLIATEPLADGGTRLLSRYRCATSGDLRTRLGMGPALMEPIGFAMDRRMLLGIAARVGDAETGSPGR